MNPVSEGWWPRNTCSSLVYSQLCNQAYYANHLPATQGRVLYFDDDIAIVLNLRNWTLSPGKYCVQTPYIVQTPTIFNLDLVRSLEHNSFHRSLRHICFLLLCSSNLKYQCVGTVASFYMFCSEARFQAGQVSSGVGASGRHSLFHGVMLDFEASNSAVVFACPVRESAVFGRSQGAECVRGHLWRRYIASRHALYHLVRVLRENIEDGSMFLLPEAS